MRNLLIVSISLLMLTCNVKTKENEIPLPFKGISIDSMKVEIEFETGDTRWVLDTLSLDKIAKHLEKINSYQLSKRKRLHGASTLCNAYIYTNKKKYLVNILKHPTEGIIANFLEQKQGSDFQSYLGAYSNAEEIYTSLVK